MEEERPVREGDRIVHLGAPGVFTVMARRGHLLDIESDRGFRKTVHEVAVRRLMGAAAVPKE